MPKRPPVAVKPLIISSLTIPLSLMSLFLWSDMQLKQSRVHPIDNFEKDKCFFKLESDELPSLDAMWWLYVNLCNACTAFQYFRGNSTCAHTEWCPPPEINIITSIIQTCPSIVNSVCQYNNIKHIVEHFYSKVHHTIATHLHLAEATNSWLIGHQISHYFPSKAIDASNQADKFSKNRVQA